MYFNGGDRHPRVTVGAALPGVLTWVPRFPSEPLCDVLMTRLCRGINSSWWAGARFLRASPLRRAAAQPGAGVDPAAGDRPADDPDAAAHDRSPPDEPATTTTSTTVDPAPTTTEVTTPE